MGGKWSRNKGAAWERATVVAAEAIGLAARRFPQCGEKDRECDVQIESDHHSYDLEVKKQHNPSIRAAFKQAVERCQEGHIPVARVTADRKGLPGEKRDECDDVAVLPWSHFLTLIRHFCLDGDNARHQA